MKRITKSGFKNIIIKISLCLFVLMTPLMLCLYGLQARKYSKLTMEIKALEEKQSKLIEENKLLKAKTEAYQSQKKSEELFAEAIKAMRSYSGHADEVEYDDYY